MPVAYPMEKPISDANNNYSILFVQKFLQLTHGYYKSKISHSMYMVTVTNSQTLVVEGFCVEKAASQACMNSIGCEI